MGASKPPPTGIKCPGFVSESAPFASLSKRHHATSGNRDDAAGVGVLPVEPPPHVSAIGQRADGERDSPPRSILARVEAFGLEGVGDYRRPLGALVRRQAGDSRMPSILSHRFFASASVSDRVPVASLAVDATAINAARNVSGNSFPRFSARRRMPAQALGLKKYWWSISLVFSIEESEYMSALLRDGAGV